MTQPIDAASDPKKVFLVSLGCPKNLVDSEVFMGDICSRGYQVTDTPEEADILMVNTCGFIDNAKEESIDNILEMVSYKEDSDKKVVVTGCLGQRYPEQLSAEIPEVDAIIGLSEYERMADILGSLVGESERKTPRVEVQSPNHPAYSEGSRLRLTPSHSTYLRISEGCDNPCTFCSIPSFRGRFRSKSVDKLLDEARELIDSGATELNLISQDLTSFGSENGGEYQLPMLLEKLNDLPGARWIRLLYTYPYKFSNAMIDAVAQLPKVVNYIDMPIQHINDRMLRRMGRRMGEQGTRDLFYRMRERIEDLVLRTTFIVGFPGETDQEFQQLVDFVEEMRIERVGVFTYSDEDGTPAVKLQPKVESAVQQQRLEALMLAQQQVAFDWNQQRVGQEFEVLIDGYEMPEVEPDAGSDADPDHDSAPRLYGRSYAEAPEIDSRIYLPAGCGQPGEYVRVRVVGVEDYDLVATPGTQT